MVMTFSENEEILGLNLWNELDLLRLIAVGSVLVKLFKTGLQTYCSKNSEYKQFSKRLGHLLQDTVNYVTDVLEEYKLVVYYVFLIIEWPNVINHFNFFFVKLLHHCSL